MDKKNILIATQTMGIGGCETYIEILCRELKRQNYEVSIVAKDGMLRKNLEAVGVKIHVLDFFNRTQSVENIKEIEEIIEKDKIDIVFIQPFYPLFEAVIASINKRVPYYIFFHGVSLKGYFDINDSFENLGKWNSMYMKNIALKYAKKFVYVSNEVQQFYEENLQLNKNRGILLKNSVEITENYEIPQKIEKFILLSRLDIDKLDSVKVGIEFFVRLCEKSNDAKKFSLDIVGDGKEKHIIKKFIEQYKNYNIKLVGPTTNSYDTISKYDALLGMGRTIIEAISLNKLPILITYDKYIGIVEKNILDKIEYANFSGRNMEPKDINTEINKILNIDEETLKEITSNNFNYINDNNNINKNIKPLVEDMNIEQEYDIQDESEIKKYVELVEYINNLEKDLQYYTKLMGDIEGTNSPEKKIIKSLKSELNDKNNQIKNNENTIKYLENTVEYYKKLLNDIYNKKVYKIYQKIKSIIK